MLVHSPGELTMAQVMVRPTGALVAEDSTTQWSFGEFAVIAGWGFFALGLLKGLWTLLWWFGTPRKPGREGRAETTFGTEAVEKIEIVERTCTRSGKTEDAETPGRSWSPRREWTQESPGKSPEARQAHNSESNA